MKNNTNLHIWLPTIKAGSGADVYIIRLRDALERKGIKTTITWFKHLLEIAPFMIKGRIPKKTNLIIASSWNAFAFKHQSIPLISIAYHCVFDEQFIPYKSYLQTVYHNNLIYHYEKLSLKKSDYTIAISQYTADSYKRSFSVKNIQVIPCWIDTQLFKTTNVSYNNPKKRLLFIGNWTKRKGVDIIPEIMQQLGEEYELICTSGMRKKRANKSLPTNIKFIGHLPQQKSLIELYQSADLLLFPSKLEGFGYSPLEAHACGLPVVASNSSAIPEVVQDGETGILCPVNDVSAYVKAVKDISNDTEKYNQMAINARKRAVALFSEDFNIRQYIKLLKTML